MNPYIVPGNCCICGAEGFFSARYGYGADWLSNFRCVDLSGCRKRAATKQKQELNQKEKENCYENQSRRTESKE